EQNRHYSRKNSTGAVDGFRRKDLDVKRLDQIVCQAVRFLSLNGNRSSQYGVEKRGILDRVEGKTGKGTAVGQELVNCNVVRCADRRYAGDIVPSNDLGGDVIFFTGAGYKRQAIWSEFEASIGLHLCLADGF